MDVSEEVYLSAVKGRQNMREALREAREKLATARNDALEEAAAYHDKAAADCENIADVNPGTQFALDCVGHAADHRVAADEIRAMKR